jgi:uncharacterized OB-fold protein
MRLNGSRDKSSGKGVFPAIPETLPAALRYEPILLSAEGALYSYTIIHPHPKTGLAHFVLAYVDYPEDVRVFGRVQLPEGVPPSIGMTLCTVSADEAEGFLFVSAGENVA